MKTLDRLVANPLPAAAVSRRVQDRSVRGISGRWALLALLAGTVGGATAAIAGAPRSMQLTLPTSTGPAGIDADRLHEPPIDLLGRKIGLGQVEIGRPARFGLDKLAANSDRVRVAGRFVLEQIAANDEHVDPHAHSVAGVMVGRLGKVARGVAPGARLYSVGTGFSGGNGQAQECLASQFVASQNGGDVRAINYSFGEPLSQDRRWPAKLDGNSLLTLCVDWSARQHDVLYLIAGNQGNGGISIPTDTFNGMNIAFARRFEGVFSKVDFSNLGNDTQGFGRRLNGLESNDGRRRSISLIAPGAEVALYNPSGEVHFSSGTSFATPHVTATVALLQEWGDRQLAARRPHWSLDARHHQVMKAVLLNSADKLKDAGDGQRLGMTRDVFREDHKTWLEGDAANDDTVPLDEQIGAGHLNAYRAWQQFAGGQWNPAAGPVPAIAWDFNRLAAEPGQNLGGPNLAEPSRQPNYRDYVLESPLAGGSYAAVTLAWSRRVDLVDANGNGGYDVGEGFRDRGLADFDVYLLPAEDATGNQRICASISAVDSNEHFFCPIPATGRYKIRVVLRAAAADPAEDYALAWWTVPAGR